MEVKQENRFCKTCSAEFSVEFENKTKDLIKQEGNTIEKANLFCVWCGCKIPAY